MKLSTTQIHLNNISNPVNASLLNEFYQYSIEIGTSVNYQNQNLKQLINFAATFRIDLHLTKFLAISQC